MKKILIFSFVLILLIGSVQASAVATIAMQGLSSTGPEGAKIVEAINLAICASNPIACAQGKVIGQVYGEAMQELAKSSPEAVKLVETYNQVQLYTEAGAEITEELQVNKEGEIEKGTIQFSGDEEVNIGHLIGLEEEDASVKGVEVRKERDKSILTFLDEDSSVNIKGNKFENIQAQSESGPLAYLELDEKGNIIKADFTTNENGGIYNFGEGKFEVPPNSRVYYNKENEEPPRVKCAEDSEIKQINDFEGEVTYEGNFKIIEEGTRDWYLNEISGKVTVSNGKIIKVWEGSNVAIRDVYHDTFGNDLNLYYEKDFDSAEHRSENYFNYGKDKIWLGGEGYKSIFDRESPIIDPFSEGNLEISPKGGFIKIEKRYRQAPKITITGDKSDDVWAELENRAKLENRGITLEVGNAGMINPRKSVREDTNEYIPLELNILDENSNSLIRDKDGREIKISISEKGSIRFSTLNAEVGSGGYPYCNPFLNSPNTISPNVILGRAVSISGCKDDYFTFEKEFSSKIKINNAKEEYKGILDKTHNFKPEYDNDLSRPIHTLNDEHKFIYPEILQNIKDLPDYSEPIVFYQSSDAIEYLKKRLPKERFNKIKFVPCGGSCPIWSQDSLIGDRNRIYRPLTYLGGYKRDPSAPGNEFIYNLEEIGIEVVDLPIDIAGGNIFITQDKNGKKILLNGPDDYIWTTNSYKSAGMVPPSEEEFKNILKNAFNVDEVMILGDRDDEGNLMYANELVFHIDQVMLPISEGIVAMPIVDIRDSSLSEKELSDVMNVKQTIDSYREIMKKKGYEIVNLKTNANSILNYQAYTNGLVYTDRYTGQKTIVMPIFPNEKGKYKMEGLNLENKRAFEKAGYKVRVVKDKAFKQGGNLHCITMLAQTPQNPPSCPLA